MPRFAILEHTGAPDDPAGRHFDLLLEVGEACRTWRLGELPRAGGPPVTALELPPHRLAWLDHEEGEVSGDRGFARRITAGTYRVVSGDLNVDEASTDLVIADVIRGRTLRLTPSAGGWAVVVIG